MNELLVTGCAGFIGFHVAKRLLEDGYQVVGVDHVNDYYDVGLKESRLELLEKYEGFQYYRESIEDDKVIQDIFYKHQFPYVIHLAAQPGVRYSLVNPRAYIDANIVGFLNILEGCRHTQVKHLIYASSSSVYGGNKRTPFKTCHNVDHPVSLYAATKKANELMAHTYSHLYQIPTTGLRFFTVYGPWGRPDMALFLFTKAILEEKPIKVFNHGKMVRDFTYIDDIVEALVRLIPFIPEGNTEWGDEWDCSTSFAPYKIYNIGNHHPIQLETFIDVLENKLAKKAIREYVPIQPGDVTKTFSDVKDLEMAIGFKPETSIEDGIEAFVKWYRWYYHK